MIRLRNRLEMRALCEGSTAVEFALILPLLLLFLFGTIDVGRYMWSVNQVEKATQMGARMAVVTDMVPGGLASLNYGTSLGQGAPIPTSSFGAATCQKPSGTVTCTCLTTPCPTLTPVNSTSFNAMVARVRFIAPIVDESDVTIEYANSGLGFAGDPNGPDVAPLVTVTANNISFQPMSFMLFGGSVDLPLISATLSLEDGAGTISN